MYSRLFGVGFTVEFAVFPIPQNSVFSGIFLLHSASPLSLLCLGTQLICLGDAEEQGWGERMHQDCTGTCLTVVHFHWGSPGGFPCPRLEADPISNSAEVQAECACSFALSLIPQNSEKSKRTFYENTKYPCCLFPKHP